MVTFERFQSLGSRILIGAILVTLVAGCAPGSAPPAKPAEGTKPGEAAKPAASGPAAAGTGAKLRLALNNPILNPGISFGWLGKELGYWQEEGLDLEFVGTQGAAEATQWIASGKVEFGYPPPSALVNAAADGNDLGLVCVYLFNRQPIYETSVLPESPITTLQDLRGKKVGVLSLGDESAIFANEIMDELGLPRTEIQLIAVGAGVQAAAQLKQGAVDVLMWADVQRALAEGQGFAFRQLEAPKFTENIFGNQVVVRKDFLAQNRQAVVGFLRNLAKGLLFMVTNPEAAIMIHYKVYPETLPRGMSAEDAVKANLSTLLVRNPKLLPKPGEKWGENSKELWEFYVRNYLGFGPDKVRDPSQFFTNELLDEVNDFDQEAIIQQARNWKPS
jgi:NitT/TauT family transport system substrate-binding protein